MSEDRVPLSVLDLAVVPEGVSVTNALRNSIDLAQHVERLGYTRYWVAEHHNMPGIASSAPAVLLAHAASATSTIRVGSGGVMLPNHSPLVVAEQFGMLEALHPGRVDLGLGRAPGTDQLTMRALRRWNPNTLSDGEDFPAQFMELVGYFTGHFAEGHPFSSITAVPGLGNEPALWLLGSSTYGAQMAGVLGLPYSFAHHFAPENTMAAVDAYHRAFRPSDVLDEPYLMLGVSAIVADDEARARYLAKPGLLSWVRLRSGRPGRMPTPEEADEYQFTPVEHEFARHRLLSQTIGDPDSVRTRLLELIERTGANELMVTTMVHGHADRLRSYELLAEAWALTAAAT
ncbi:MAG: LLM class flavin-dependent oxidoreductase [Acidimicrobiia bacterium]